MTLTAGTTRKIVAFMGAAFAGFELQGIKKIKLQIKNSYYDAFSLRGRYHNTPMYWHSKRFFAGIMLNYHTSKGYTKKVALGAGVMADNCNTVYPTYAGGKQKPDQLIDLGNIVNQGPVKVLSLNLAKYAPPDWDGQVWLSIGSDCVAADRILTAKILAVNGQVTGPFAKGSDPAHLTKLYNKARSATASKVSYVPIIDGNGNDFVWHNTATIEPNQFFLLGGKGRPTMKTTAKVSYDSHNLYVLVHCRETQRKAPITTRNTIWHDDEIEIWMNFNNDTKSFKQLIVNAAGKKMAMDPNGPTHFGARVAAHVGKNSWTVEAAIPFKGLGIKTPKPGQKWKFNICRHRPGGGDIKAEAITWSPLKHKFDEPNNFNTLIFGK